MAAFVTGSITALAAMLLGLFCGYRLAQGLPPIVLPKVRKTAPDPQAAYAEETRWAERR